MRPILPSDHESSSSAIGPAGPSIAVWDVAGAPARTGEPGRQLRHEELVRIADAIVKLRPGLVTFAGGEPLAVPGLVDVAARVRAAGIAVGLTIGTGRRLDDRTAEDVCRVFDHVTICFGGATAAVHDATLGHIASFEQTLRSAATVGRAAGSHDVRLGVDYEITRRNIAEVGRFCTDVVPRLANLAAVAFNAMVPGTLSGRPGQPRPRLQDLLDDEQFAGLGDGLAYRLRELVPPAVTVTVSDNRELRMDPEARERFPYFRPLLVEPGGAVRAMPLYYGTVGSLLDEQPHVVWRRAVRRWDNPFVTRTLARVRTVRDWVEATAALDYRFGAADPGWPAAR